MELEKKFVVDVGAIFGEKGTDVHSSAEGDGVLSWESFSSLLLCTVDEKYLYSLVARMSWNVLFERSESLHLFFVNCLTGSLDTNESRVENSLRMMRVVLECILRKPLSYSSKPLEIVRLLGGEQGESFFSRICGKAMMIISQRRQLQTHHEAVKLILVVFLCQRDVTRNSLVEIALLSFPSPISAVANTLSCFLRQEVSKSGLADPRAYLYHIFLLFSLISRKMTSLRSEEDDIQVICTIMGTSLEYYSQPREETKSLFQRYVIDTSRFYRTGYRENLSNPEILVWLVGTYEAVRKADKREGPIMPPRTYLAMLNGFENVVKEKFHDIAKVGESGNMLNQWIIWLVNVDLYCLLENTSTLRPTDETQLPSHDSFLILLTSMLSFRNRHAVNTNICSFGFLNARRLLYSMKVEGLKSKELPRLAECTVSLLNYIVTTICGHKIFLTEESAADTCIAEGVRLLEYLVTYGDSLYTTPDHYELLFYEFIRWNDLFEKMRVATEKSVTVAAIRTLKDLSNIIAVNTHFQKQSEGVDVKRMKPNQILKILRNSFQDLNLYFIDGLDEFKPYSEAQVVFSGSREAKLLKKTFQYLMNESSKQPITDFKEN